MPNETTSLDTGKDKRLIFLLLIVFFLLAYILPLGARDLLVPDETRYAEIPREMLVSGNWIVPHFDGLRYFEKPVLGYWLHAGAIDLFGQNNFAVRFPSALAAGLSALLIFFLVRKISRDDDEDDFQAPLAALVFLSCFEVVGVGNIALLDNILSFFLTATIIAFYLATESPPGTKKEKMWLVTAGVGCGLAFLTKGFLALAVPVLVLAPYLLWQRRPVDLLRMTWLPILVAVGVSLPWSIAIWHREPDFWHYFFWIEHVHRFLSPHAQHEATFWLFFLAAPVLFLPWSMVVPAAVAGLGKLAGGADARRRLIRLSWCWLVLPFLFFSASHGKLLTYILPCFPPFAILAAFGLSGIAARGRSRILQAGLAVAAGLFVLLLAALIVNQATGLGGGRLFVRQWKALLVAVGLAGVIFFCMESFFSTQWRKKLLLFGLAPLPLFFLIHFTIPNIVIEQSAPGRLLERYRDRLHSDTVIISGEDAVGAACWFLKNDHVYLLRNAGELAYGLRYKDGAGRLLGVAGTKQLIEKNPGKTAIIVRKRTLRGLGRGLPPPVDRYDSGPQGYVLLFY